MKNAIIACIVALTAFNVSSAQTKYSSAELQQQLESKDPQTRVMAFEALRSIPGAFSAPANRQALLGLLRRENDANAAALRASGGNSGIPSGVPAGLDESFAEYSAQVLEDCAKYCDKDGFLAELLRRAHSDRYEIRTTTIKLFAAYALPKAGFTGRQRATMDSALLINASDRSNPYVRELGVLGVGGVLAADLGAPDSWRSQAHAAVVSAASERDPSLRLAAVRALGDIGDQRDVPLLRSIAATDAARSTGRGAQEYFVRTAAERAIAKIQP